MAKYVTTYNPEKALEILERIADGETLNAICKGQPGMPSPTTFKRWAVNNPELAKAYIAAITISASSLEEEALDSARALALLPKDAVLVSAVRTKLDQLRWSAERRDPAKFGTRTQVNVRVPVQIITSLNLGDGEGGPASQDIYNIEASVPTTIGDAAAIVPKRIHGSLPGPRGPRKTILTPRNPFYTKGNPSARAQEPIRTKSDQPSDQESGRKQGDSVPDSRAAQEDHINSGVNPNSRREEGK